MSFRVSLADAVLVAIDTYMAQPGRSAWPHGSLTRKPAKAIVIGLGVAVQSLQHSGSPAFDGEQQNVTLRPTERERCCSARTAPRTAL